MAGGADAAAGDQILQAKDENASAWMPVAEEACAPDDLPQALLLTEVAG